MTVHCEPSVDDRTRLRAEQDQPSQAGHRASARRRVRSSTLGSQWTVVRPDTTHYSLTANPGELTLTPEHGDIAGNATGATNIAQNIVVQHELGNWTITTKAIFSTIPNGPLAAHASGLGQQAGIIAYQNDDDYLEFGLVASDGTPELAIIHQDNLGYSTGPLGGPAPNGVNNTIYKTLATSTIPALANGTNIRCGCA